MSSTKEVAEQIVLHGYGTTWSTDTELVAAIDEALQHREQEVRAEGWLPIESAPRTDRKWLVVARFDSNGKRLWWERAAWRQKWQQWRAHGGFCEPTHWLRLPTTIRRDSQQEGEQSNGK